MDIQELMNRVAQNLSVGRAFGTAYEKGGTLVIPVAFVAGGGGGGEGTTVPGSDAQESEAPSGGHAHHGEPSSGSGGGFGGVVLPVGAYVVKDESVRWIPAVSVNIAILAGLSVVRLLVRARRRARRRHHRG